VNSRTPIVVVLAVALVVCAVGIADTAYAGIVPKESPERFELIFWDTIKDSDNPADYDAYLEAYPQGRFAPLARARGKSLREQQATQRQATSGPKIEDMDAEFKVLKNARLREKPDASSKNLGTLKQGLRVIVTGKVVDSDWYRIETADGKSGFVFGKLIAETQRDADQAAARQAAAAEAVRKAAAAEAARKAAAQAAAAEEARKAAEKAAAEAEAAEAARKAAESKAAGTKPSAVETFKDCDACPEMIVLPAGSFTMGAKDGDTSEAPPHRVKIGYSLAISRFEITAAQWKACFTAGGCDYRPKRKGMTATSPVHNLSWLDAQQYVKWLSKKTGKKYRLPSEAEWEYAARAGTKTAYWWGDAVGEGNANCKNCGGDWNRKRPAVVDSYDANAFGLQGMNGSVWEWVADCWFDSYKGAPNDGSARDRKDCQSRVLRGGSWRNDASYARSAGRFTYDHDVRYVLNGFRVVHSMK